MVSLGFTQLTSPSVAGGAAVESYRRIPRFGSSTLAALFRRLPASTTTTATTGSPGQTASPQNVVTAVLLATDNDAAIVLDSFAHAGTPDRSGTARGANGGPNITTTEGPMEDEPPKLILYIVLPVCLAVIAFVLVAVAVRCFRRRKAANQARNETPDLWIRNSQELPLYAVDCTLPPTKPELPVSPKTDLSTICEVLQTYVPQSPRELQLVKGEFLKIVEKDPKGWCRGVIGTHIGWFPGSFVKEIRTASLIEASDDEEDEEEVVPPERLKPRVSSFMIKKRVIKSDENGQLPNDDESRILSRSHSEFGDIISLPRSRASTAGSSIYDDPEYVRFHQRSPACRLSIPDRFRNGSLDLRLGPPLLNGTDNPYPMSRRMYPRRSEPISLLLHVPPSSRTNPPRPTRPAPPPPPSRKSAFITSTVAPSITTSTSADSPAWMSSAPSPSSTTTNSEASITLNVPPPPLITQSSAPAQLQVSDPVPAPLTISAPIPIQIPVTTQNLIPIQNADVNLKPAEDQIPAPTPAQEQIPIPPPAQEKIPIPPPIQEQIPIPSPAQEQISVPPPAHEQIPVSSSAQGQIPVPLPVQEQIPVSSPAQEQILVSPPVQEEITPPFSVKSQDSEQTQTSVETSIPLQVQTLEPIQNETSVPVQKSTLAQSPVPVQAPVVLQPEPQAQIVLNSPKCPVPKTSSQVQQVATETLEVKQKTPPPTQPKPPPPAVQPKPVIKPQSLPPPPPQSLPQFPPQSYPQSPPQTLPPPPPQSLPQPLQESIPQSLPELIPQPLPQSQPQLVNNPELEVPHMQQVQE